MQSYWVPVQNVRHSHRVPGFPQESSPKGLLTNDSKESGSERIAGGIRCVDVDGDPHLLAGRWFDERSAFFYLFSFRSLPIYLL